MRRRVTVTARQTLSRPRRVGGAAAAAILAAALLAAGVVSTAQATPDTHAAVISKVTGGAGTGTPVGGTTNLLRGSSWALPALGATNTNSLRGSSWG